MDHFLVRPPRDTGIEGLVLHENFLTPAEERDLLARIDAQRWNTSLKRRTQHWCDLLVDRLLDQGVLVSRPDQMIINEYQPGQGIAAHIDNTSAFADGIVSVSLGSDVVMDFVNADDKKELRLPRRSALSLHGPARYEWRHGIAQRKTDHGHPRARRVSLTFRKMKE